MRKESKPKSPKKTATKKSTTKIKTKAKTVTPVFRAHATQLKAGMPAPNFEGLDSTGKKIKLTDFRGRKLILYFYPKDNTPACTATACSLRDDYSFFTSNNCAVIGVSADDEKSHQKFISKFGLPFPLIMDVDKIIISAYDVWGRKMLAGRIYDGIIRTTFIIDENGIIQLVINKVNSVNHSDQIKELIFLK